MNEAFDYLDRRQQQLNFMHPNWQHSLLKEVEPICIPPSWDVIKKYAGALRGSGAAGFDADFYNHGELKFKGDHGEAFFLSLIQESRIGGIFIGNIDSRHMLRQHGIEQRRKYDYLLPECLADTVTEVVEATVSTKYKIRYFEIDFVLLHPLIGIHQIEVKRTTNASFSPQMLKDGIWQLSRGRLKRLFTKFCALLFPHENPERIWEQFDAGGSVFFAQSNAIFPDKDTQSDEITTELTRLNIKVDDQDVLCLNFGDFEKRINGMKNRNRNFFDDEIFQYFTAFLAGFRPDFFISPALCALQTYNNIWSSEICSIVYYENAKKLTIDTRVEMSLKNKFSASMIEQCCIESLNDDAYTTLALKTKHMLHTTINQNDGNLLGQNDSNRHVFEPTSSVSKIVAACHKFVKQFDLNKLIQQIREQFRDVVFPHCADILHHAIANMMRKEITTTFSAQQNLAKTAQEYLEELRLKRLIRHSHIVLSNHQHQEIYFTAEQLNAINVFDEHDQISPSKCQLIVGPPGSGKSLVLMMKLFILKQIRLHKKLAYVSWTEHRREVENFARDNKCDDERCCREIEFAAIDGETVYKMISSFIASPDHDIVLDECRHTGRSRGLKRVLNEEWNNLNDTMTVIVVTGGTIIRGDIAELIPHPQNFHELSTVFRSTNRIQRLIGTLLDCEIVGGHSFDGVPVERYDLQSQHEAVAAAKDKLRHLLDPRMSIHAYLGENGKITVLVPSRTLFDEMEDKRVDVKEFIDIPSLEFPLVVAVCDRSEREKHHLTLLASRVVCHLILFTYLTEEPRLTSFYD